MRKGVIIIPKKTRLTPSRGIFKTRKDQVKKDNKNKVLKQQKKVLEEKLKLKSEIHALKEQLKQRNTRKMNRR